MLVQKYTVDPLPPDVCFGPERLKSSIAYEKTECKLVLCGWLDGCQVQSVLTLVALSLPNGRKGAATHDPDVFRRFGYAMWVRIYCLFACLDGPLFTHLLVIPSCLGGSAKIALMTR